MLSIDTTLLLSCYSEASPHHRAARQFIESVSNREGVALSEFVLTEFATANVRDFEGLGFVKVCSPLVS
jgi:predicted nucleic acid-binding protein